MLGNGDTLLHIAARTADINLASSVLFYNYADAGQWNRSGDAAIHIAARSGHLEVMQLLVEHHSAIYRDISAIINNIPTIDVQTDSIDLAYAILFYHYADAGQWNRSGDAAIHIATRNGHLDMVQYLLNHGVEVGQENIEGDTSLHIATRSGRLDMVQLSLQYGADISQINHANETPWSLAMQLNNNEISQIFFQHYSAQASQAVSNSAVLIDESRAEANPYSAFFGEA